MFDVSFSELMLIGVIALIVIGPERLPKVARTVGHLLGRAQRYVSEVKSDIQREIDLKEIGDLKNQMQDAARSVQTSMEDSVGELKSTLDESVGSLASTVDEARAAIGHAGSTPPAAEPPATTSQAKKEDAPIETPDDGASQPPALAQTLSANPTAQVTSPEPQAAATAHSSEKQA